MLQGSGKDDRGQTLEMFVAYWPLQRTTNTHKYTHTDTVTCACRPLTIICHPKLKKKLDIT